MRVANLFEDQRRKELVSRACSDTINGSGRAAGGSLLSGAPLAPVTRGGSTGPLASTFPSCGALSISSPEELDADFELRAAFSCRPRFVPPGGRPAPRPRPLPEDAPDSSLELPPDVAG
eukprot:3405469-Prymnesium_polylepis.1